MGERDHSGLGPEEGYRAYRESSMKRLTENMQF